MNLFIDSTAQIQDGEKDVTESFPRRGKISSLIHIGVKYYENSYKKTKKLVDIVRNSLVASLQDL